MYMFYRGKFIEGRYKGNVKIDKGQMKSALRSEGAIEKMIKVFLLQH